MKSMKLLRQARLQEWAAKFQDQAQSGLTVDEWCAQNNITRSSYYYWRRILRDEYVESMIPEIVPVPQTIVKEASLPQGECNTVLQNFQKFNNRLHISMDGFDIAVDDSVSDERLLHLIKAARYA